MTTRFIRAAAIMSLTLGLVSIAHAKPQHSQGQGNAQSQYNTPQYPTNPDRNNAYQNYPSQGQGTPYGQSSQNGQNSQGQNGYQSRQNNQGQQYRQNGQSNQYQSGQYGQSNQYRQNGQKGKGHKGKGKNGHRGYSSNCPPGLMDKGCMPPGQAKKYQLGSALPNDMYRWFDYARHGLPRPRDGYYYSRDNRDVVLVSAATRNVVELVTILEELF